MLTGQVVLLSLKQPEVKAVGKDKQSQNRKKQVKYLHILSVCGEESGLGFGFRIRTQTTLK